MEESDRVKLASDKTPRRPADIRLEEIGAPQAINQEELLAAFPKKERISNQLMELVAYGGEKALEDYLPIFASSIQIHGTACTTPAARASRERVCRQKLCKAVRILETSSSHHKLQFLPLQVNEYEFRKESKPEDKELCATLWTPASKEKATEELDAALKSLCELEAADTTEEVSTTDINNDIKVEKLLKARKVSAEALRSRDCATNVTA